LTVAGRVLPFTLLEALLTTVLPVVLLMLLRPLISALVRRLFKRADLKDETRARLSRLGRRSWQVVFWVTVLALAGRLFGAESLSYLGTFLGVLNQPFYSSGGTEISVVTLLLLIPIFYAASWASRAIRRAVDRSILDRLSLDPAHRFSVSSLLRYAVMIIVLLVGLSIIGINLSSLAVIFGVLGIGLGFGLQSTVANLFAGLVIILSRPIKEGDRILVNGYEGTVTHIRVINTVINTITNESLIIPNSQIVDNYVHNYSFDDPSIWICTPVQVAYSSDLDLVQRVLLSIPAQNPYAVSGTEGHFFVRSFDDSGITVSLCTEIRMAREKNYAISWTNMAIWRRFKEEGIEIPFPQRDVYVKQIPGAQGPEGGSPVEGRPSTGAPPAGSVD
jgi:small-conductance mechanosensitive channel